MSKFHVSIFYTFREMNRQRALRSGRVGLVLVGLGRVGLGWVGSGRFIILNDLAAPKKVIKMYLNFFLFLKTFYRSLNVDEVTHIMLLIGSFVISSVDICSQIDFFLAT